MSQRKTARLIAAAAAAVGLAAGAAHAQTKAPIVVRAERCLRQNVDRVVAADHDMASAANFLVGYACAGEVEGARRYERNKAYVEMFSTMFKGIGQLQPAPAPGAKAPAPMPEFKASVDPETGLIVVPPAAPGAPANPFADMIPMMEGIFGQ